MNNSTTPLANTADAIAQACAVMRSGDDSFQLLALAISLHTAKNLSEACDAVKRTTFDLLHELAGADPIRSTARAPVDLKGRVLLEVPGLKTARNNMSTLAKVCAAGRKELSTIIASGAGRNSAQAYISGKVAPKAKAKAKADADAPADVAPADADAADADAAEAQAIKNELAALKAAILACATIEEAHKLCA